MKFKSGLAWLTWSDGPRSSSEPYDNLEDALVEFAQGIMERCIPLP